MSPSIIKIGFSTSTFGSCYDRTCKIPSYVLDNSNTSFFCVIKPLFVTTTFISLPLRLTGNIELPLFLESITLLNDIVSVLLPILWYPERLPVPLTNQLQPISDCYIPSSKISCLQYITWIILIDYIL